MSGAEVCDLEHTSRLSSLICVCMGLFLHCSGCSECLCLAKREDISGTSKDHTHTHKHTQCTFNDAGRGFKKRPEKSAEIMEKSHSGGMFVFVCG